MRIKIVLLLICGAFLFVGKAWAQDFAVKTNLLYWATTTANLQLEFGLGKRASLEIGGNYNPWTFKDNKKIKHWFVQPELRLWNCERFNRGFWGIHVIGGEANFGNVKLPFGIFPGLKKYRYEGWFYGGGVSYGYQWYLGPHWNLEATVGAGYLYFNGKRYDCAKCGAELGKARKGFFSPTKAGLTFVYLF